MAGLEAGLIQGLAPCRALPAVADVRVLGGIGVVELHEPQSLDVLQPMFVAEGIWVRPFGKLVYVMPPYVMSADDLATLTRGIYNVVSKLK